MKSEGKKHQLNNKHNSHQVTRTAYSTAKFAQANLQVCVSVIEIELQIYLLTLFFFVSWCSMIFFLSIFFLFHEKHSSYIHINYFALIFIPNFTCAYIIKIWHVICCSLENYMLFFRCTLRLLYKYFFFFGEVFFSHFHRMAMVTT